MRDAHAPERHDFNEALSIGLIDHGLEYVLSRVAAYPTGRETVDGWRAIYAVAREELSVRNALPEDAGKSRCDELRRALRELLDDE